MTLSEKINLEIELRHFSHKRQIKDASMISGALMDRILDGKTDHTGVTKRKLKKFCASVVNSDFTELPTNSNNKSAPSAAELSVMANKKVVRTTPKSVDEYTGHMTGNDNVAM